MPAPRPPADLKAADEAAAAARLEADRVRRRHREVETALKTVEGRRTAMLADLAALDRRLTGRPDLAEAVAMLERVTAAETACAAARTADRQARAAAKKAGDAVDEAAAAPARAEQALEEARDRVAALAPPARQRSDVAADWRALMAWAAGRAEAEKQAAAAARTEAEAIARERAMMLGTISERCRGEGVIVASDAEPRDAVVDARAAAEAERQKLAAAVAEAERVREEADRATDDVRIAHGLGTHLSSRGFEKWLLGEAVATLVDGANEILGQLSGGQYALSTDASGNFLVVDHRSADETRSARTLSGGETFLASLALALALSDRIAELAAAGAARLDAIFLDEGFGTLDADTLATVGAAMETLGAGGRMVGLVTHVRELADQVPVRYEVRKGPLTSTIEKVVA
jgi:exonuclease SbcC